MCRDPRADPQPGDRIKVNGRTRRVIWRRGNEIGYVFDPPEVCKLLTWINWGHAGEVVVDPVECNLPFERVPQHRWDPGVGPVPPMPKECPHGVSTAFPCPDCNAIQTPLS